MHYEDSEDCKGIFVKYVNAKQLKNNISVVNQSSPKHIVIHYLIYFISTLLSGFSFSPTFYPFLCFFLLAFRNKLNTLTFPSFHCPEGAQILSDSKDVCVLSHHVMFHKCQYQQRRWQLRTCQ